VGVVPGGSNTYNYYSFPVVDPGNDVAFALTASAGDPDIYIGVWRSATYRPSRDPSACPRCI
jgi:hypothetical protein